MDGLAVGRQAVVASTAAEVALFDKNGSRIAVRPWQDFFAAVLPVDHVWQDPRVAYDPASDRFFAVSASGPNRGCETDDPCGNVWMIAASRSGSPRSLTGADWSTWGLNGKSLRGQPTPYWGDFNVFGFADGIVTLNGQMVTHASGHEDAVYDKLWVFNKDDLSSGARDLAPRTEYDNLSDPRTGQVLAQRILAAQSAEPETSVWLAHFGIDECDLVVLHIDPPAANATLEARNVRVPGHCREMNYGIGAQRDGPSAYIHPQQTSPPIYSNGSLWVAQVVPVEVGATTVTGVRVTQLDVSRWPDVTVLSDARLGEANASYGYPVLAADARGDAIVAYVHFDNTSYPTLMAAARFAGEPPGSFHAATTLRNGVVPYTVAQLRGGLLYYGGYAASALDPVDGSAWILSHVPQEHCGLGIILAHLAFEQDGPPIAQAVPPEPPVDSTPCPG